MSEPARDVRVIIVDDHRIVLDGLATLIVSITTAMPGCAVVMRRVASTPPMPGISMSMSTTSGRSSPASTMACSPEVISPTTSMPSTESRELG
jgi:hypothetical protein